MRAPDPLCGWRRDQRSQTATLGLVLMFGVMIAGAAIVVAIGGMAMSDTQDSLSEQRAEKALTQFDSKAALVALGNTDVQRVSLPKTGTDSYEIRPDEGWMNVSYHTADGDENEIFNETMGSVVYETEEGEISYQGGGVWKTTSEGNAVMVSPPEFHYRDRTLTLPMMSVEGEDSLNGRATITHDRTVQHFPNESRSNFFNPLNGSEVNVTVQSEYYRGWGKYFKTRTNGDVTYDHDRQIVMISLIPPFEEDYENAVATTASGSSAIQLAGGGGGGPPGGGGGGGGSSDPSPAETGVNYPDLDERIESKISSCQSGSCKSATTSINDDGTYYWNGDATGNVDVDSPGGNVTLVVNGDWTGGLEAEDVSDPYSVTVYVREDFDISNDFNPDGDAFNSRAIVHSDGDFWTRGNTKFVGLLYAPQSDCEVKGSGTIEGGMICKTYHDRGAPASSFTYDSNVQGINLELTSDDVTQLQYLHVTTNEITVSSG